MAVRAFRRTSRPAARNLRYKPISAERTRSRVTSANRWFAADVVARQRGRTASLIHAWRSVGSGLTGRGLSLGTGARLFGAHTLGFSSNGLGSGFFQRAAAVEVGVKRGGTIARSFRHLDHARIADGNEGLGKPDFVRRSSSAVGRPRGRLHAPPRFPRGLPAPAAPLGTRP